MAIGTKPTQERRLLPLSMTLVKQSEELRALLDGVLARVEQGTTKAERPHNPNALDEVADNLEEAIGNLAELSHFVQMQLNEKV